MRAQVKLDGGREYVYEVPHHVKAGDRVDLPASAVRRGITGTVTALGAGGYAGPAKPILRVRP
jgi:hypothetical protein